MKYKLSHGVILEEVENNQILVTDMGDVAVLNDTASTIVVDIVNGLEHEELEEKFINTYDVNSDEIKQDLAMFIDKLIERNFIQQEDA